MALKTIIFDLDNTLIYIAPEYRYLVVGKALGEFGKSTENSVIDDFWFGSEDERTEIIRGIWGLDPEGEFWPAYRRYDKVKLREQHSRVYEDSSILAELSKKKITTGIVTAAPRDMIEFEIGMLKHEFDAVVRAQLVENIEPKPSPQGIDKCLAFLDVVKREACYVGDTETDMETADNARVRGILIDRRERKLTDVRCFRRIDSLYSLRSLF